MRKEIFENPALYSQYLSIGGMRVNESGTTPSVYITEVKLRRAIKELSDESIGEIFKNKTPMGIPKHREELTKKIEKLQDWQLFKALDILMSNGNYDAVHFIRKCRRSDKEKN